MSREKEITSSVLTELELVTLYEAFNIVHVTDLFIIERNGKAWINDSTTLGLLGEKLNKMMEKIEAAQPTTNNIIRTSIID